MGPSKHFSTSPSECFGPSKPLQTKPSEGLLLSRHLSTTPVRGCWGFQASLGGGSFSPRPGSDTTHQPKPGSNIIISLFRIKAPHVRGYAAAAPFHQNRAPRCVLGWSNCVGLRIGCATPPKAPLARSHLAVFIRTSFVFPYLHSGPGFDHL